MIYIRKNGIFYENGYSPEAEEYIFAKVESFIPYLNEIVHIDYEITLEDLFLFFERDENIINIIFGSAMGHNPLSAYIEDIKKDCMDESREDMEYIECSWTVTQFDYKEFYEKHKNDEEDLVFGQLHKPDEDDKNEISIYVDVHGWGKFEPQKDEVYKKGEKPPTHISYAIEFTPLYRMKHLPIRLDKKFTIQKKNYDYIEDVKDIVSGEHEFSVYEVIGAILSELTFAGLPDERDEQWKDITDNADEYREKMEDDDEEDEE